MRPVRRRSHAHYYDTAAIVAHSKSNTREPAEARFDNIFCRRQKAKRELFAVRECFYPLSAASLPFCLVDAKNECSSARVGKGHDLGKYLVSRQLTDAITDFDPSIRRLRLVLRWNERKCPLKLKAFIFTRAERDQFDDVVEREV